MLNKFDCIQNFLEIYFVFDVQIYIIIKHTKAFRWTLAYEYQSKSRGNY